MNELLDKIMQELSFHRVDGLALYDYTSYERWVNIDDIKQILSDHLVLISTAKNNNEMENELDATLNALHEEAMDTNTIIRNYSDYDVWVNIDDVVRVVEQFCKPQLPYAKVDVAAKIHQLELKHGKDAIQKELVRYLDEQKRKAEG